MDMVFNIIFIFTLIFLNPGNALKCYQCEGDLRGLCGVRQTSETFSIECPEFKYGKKVNVCVLEEINLGNTPPFSSTRIRRYCGTSEAHSTYHCFNDIHRHVCKCFEDNCNNNRIHGL